MLRGWILDYEPSAPLRLPDVGTHGGLLIDNAFNVFQTIFEEADEATKRKALLDAQRDCFAVGLTMVCDAGLDTGSLALVPTHAG